MNHIQGMDKLTQFKTQAIKPEVEWSLVYTTMMQKLNAFPRFYTDYFLKCYPLLGTTSLLNHFGDLNINDHGIELNNSMTDI